MKQKMTVYLALTMAIILLVGCAAASTSIIQPQSLASVVSTTVKDTTEEEFKEKLALLLQFRDSNISRPGMVEDDTILKYIEEKFNIDIKYDLIPAPNVTEHLEKLNLMIASGKIPDMFDLMTTGGLGQDIYQSLAANGQLVCFTDMVAQDPLRWPKIAERMSINEIQGFKYPGDGKLYCLPIASPLWEPTFAIRKDWLDALRLDVPQNTDELYNVLKQFVEKKPGGTDNLGLTSGTASELLTIVAGFTGVYEWVDTGEKYISDWFLPEKKEGIKFLAKLFEEKLIDPEVFIHQPYQDEYNKFMSGRAGAVLSTPQILFYESMLKQVNPAAELVLTPVTFSGPKAAARYSSIPWYGATAIYSKTKDPARALDLLEFLIQEENGILAKGLEGIHYTIENGTAVKNMEVFQHENWGIDPVANTHWWFRQIVNIRPYVDKDAYLESGYPEAKVDEYLEWSRASLEAYNSGIVLINPLEGLPVEATKEVGSKPSDVINSYFAKFLLGELDIDANWDKMLQEYTAAGYDKIEKEVNEKYYKK